jgi:MFS family permease
MARRSYVAVLISAVACYAALGAVLRTLPALTADRALLGLLLGAPALTAVVTRPAGGRLADRVGPAPVMLGGAVAMAAGVAPALLSRASGPLLASRLAVGAAEGAMMSAAVAWLLRLAGPARQGLALGHIGVANYARLTAGPLLAAALGSRSRRCSWPRWSCHSRARRWRSPRAGRRRLRSRTGRPAVSCARRSCPAPR